MPSARTAAPAPDARTTAGQFLDAIPNLMAHLRRHLADSGSGLTIAQYRCLKMVQRSNDVGLGDLAEANGVSAPAMSKLVDGLVDAGLLARRGHTGDRRRIVLTVTPKGRTTIGVVTAQLRDQLAARWDTLTKAQLATLAAALQHVNRSLAPGAPA